MNSVFLLVLAIVGFVAVLAAAGVILWFVLGRGKKGEDRMTGVLKEQSYLRGGSPNNGNTRPR